MKEKFFDRSFEYFYEIEYPFIKDVLQKIYGETKALRRFSLVGEGQFILIYMDNKIYEFKIKEIKKMLQDDGKIALRDETKNKVIDMFTSFLKENNIKYTKNNGKYISFPIDKYIVQIEVIKKIKEPSNLGKVRVNGIWI